MPPQPVQKNVIAGLRPAPQAGRKTSGELDEDRKQELIMEKNLRACRVNILPKVSQRVTWGNNHFLQGASMFEQPRAALPPPPKKAPPPVVSVESVKKATNPIALRYWNQCSNSSTTKETPVSVVHMMDDAPPPWVTPDAPISKIEERPMLPPKKLSVPNITGRMGRAESAGRQQAPSVRHRAQSLDRLQPQNFSPHDDPSPMGSPRLEVVKVLSTAGTGINRDNEKKEAVGNINRLFSVAMVKKDDAVRVNNAKNRSVEAIDKPYDSYEESRSYNLVKEEEIKKSQQRATFIGSSGQVRIPKSPRPFRDTTPKLEETQSPGKRSQPQFTSTEIPFSTVTDLLPKLNQQQATHIGLSLFSQMSQETVMEVLAHQLSVMSANQMATVFSGIRTEVQSSYS